MQSERLAIVLHPPLRFSKVQGELATATRLGNLISKDHVPEGDGVVLPSPPTTSAYETSTFTHKEGRMDSHPCVICAHPATQKCAACKRPYYCSKEHQQEVLIPLSSSPQG